MIKQGKCTSCGANIEVDVSQQAGMCSFCGNAYVVEHALQNVTIHSNVTNIYHTQSEQTVPAPTKKHEDKIENRAFKIFITVVGAGLIGSLLALVIALPIVFS